MWLWDVYATRLVYVKPGSVICLVDNPSRDIRFDCVVEVRETTPIIGGAALEEALTIFGGTKAECRQYLNDLGEKVGAFWGGKGSRSAKRLAEFKNSVSRKLKVINPNAS